MKASILVILALTLLLPHINAYAQQCGSGYYNAVVTNPGEQPSVINCVPIPGYSQPQAPPPPPQWQSRWGAIATDEPHGILGAVTGLPDKQSATKAALDSCYAKGGVQCKSEITYSNSCAAFVVSDGGYNANAKNTIEEASTAGMETCQNAGDKDCRVYYTACSPAVRIQ